MVLDFGNRVLSSTSSMSLWASGALLLRSDTGSVQITLGSTTQSLILSGPPSNPFGIAIHPSSKNITIGNVLDPFAETGLVLGISAQSQAVISVQQPRTGGPHDLKLQTSGSGSHIILSSQVSARWVHGVVAGFPRMRSNECVG